MGNCYSKRKRLTSQPVVSSTFSPPETKSCKVDEVPHMLENNTVEKRTELLSEPGLITESVHPFNTSFPDCAIPITVPTPLHTVMADGSRLPILTSPALAQPTSSKTDAFCPVSSQGDVEHLTPDLTTSLSSYSGYIPPHFSENAGADSTLNAGEVESIVRKRSFRSHHYRERDSPYSMRLANPSESTVVIRTSRVHTSSSSTMTSLDEITSELQDLISKQSNNNKEDGFEDQMDDMKRDSLEDVEDEEDACTPVSTSCHTSDPEDTPSDPCQPLPGAMMASRDFPLTRSQRQVTTIPEDDILHASEAAGTDDSGFMHQSSMMTSSFYGNSRRGYSSGLMATSMTSSLGSEDLMFTTDVGLDDEDDDVRKDLDASEKEDPFLVDMMMTSSMIDSRLEKNPREAAMLSRDSLDAEASGEEDLGEQQAPNRVRKISATAPGSMSNSLYAWETSGAMSRSQHQASHARQVRSRLSSLTTDPKSLPTPEEGFEKAIRRRQRSLALSLRPRSLSIPVSAAQTPHCIDDLVSEGQPPLLLSQHEHRHLMQDTSAVKLALLRLKRMLLEDDGHLPAFLNSMSNAIPEDANEITSDFDIDFSGSLEGHDIPLEKTDPILLQAEVQRLRKMNALLQGRLSDRDNSVTLLQEQMKKYTCSFDSNSVENVFDSSTQSLPRNGGLFRSKRAQSVGQVTSRKPPYIS